MSNSSFYSNTGITSADVSSITSAKEAAATSETNAATSATEAATSATQAATSATNAASSETNVSNSAATATTSAANASTSETNASASAATATTQASNAATSATAAAGSASTAGTSATNAASSATNAATSETNAATSETNAANSATSAATSATNAGTSETNAAASASAASGYVTSVTTQANNAATSATAAATSETNAASSATAASTSASGASTSASNANTSATNAASSASQAAASAAAAALAADNFDDTYLGSNASDPTTDNDGDALNAGDLHFNTSSNTLKVYNGSAWQDAAIDSSGFVQTTGDTMTGALDVQSTITADGLTVDGVVTVQGANAGVTDPLNAVNRIRFIDTDTTQVNDQPTGTLEWYTSDAGSVGVHAYISTDMFNNGSGDMLIATGSGGSPTQSMRIGSGGDISFYEDTGTTAKFFWDASAESLGIGTSSPSALIHASGAAASGGSVEIRLEDTAASSNSRLMRTGSAYSYAGVGANETWLYHAGAGTINIGPDGAGTVKIVNNGSERMRIDSSGNVGIGVSPASGRTLHVHNSSAPYLHLTNSTTGSTASDGASISMSGTSLQISNREAGVMQLYTNGSEAMRISSDGLVGIGTSSPARGLSIHKEGNHLQLTTVASGTAAGNGTDLKVNASTSDFQILNYEAANTTFWTAGTERMRIDSSGNVILNNSPASTSDNIALRIKGGTSGYSNVQFADADDVNVGMIQYNHASNYMQFTTNDSERMRIDSSGNLLLGTTSLTTGTLGTGNTFLEIAGDSGGSGTLTISRPSNTNAEEVGGIRFANANNADDDGLDADGKLIAAISVRTVTSDSNAGDDAGGDLVFYTKPEAGNYAERMRINSSGGTVIGTDPDNTGGQYLAVVNDTTTQGGNDALAYFQTNADDWNMKVHQAGQGSAYFMYFMTLGSNVGSITGTSSSTSYNTTSDHRLKENVVDLTGATTRLKQLEPKRFNFIADADTTVDGFLAHEVQTVVPEAITGTHNEVDADGNPVYQGIDQSKLVPLLVATIKELEARITALEAN